MKRLLKSLDGIASSLDLYGLPVSLLFKNQEHYSTRIGQIFSLGISVFTIFSFISLTVSLLSYENPNVIRKTLADPNPQKYYFDPEKFFFEVQISDWTGMPLINQVNYTYLNYYAQFCISENFNVTCNYIDLKICSEANISEHLMEGLSKERLTHAYCLDTNAWQKVKNLTYLVGTSTSNYFSFFSFSAYKCDNAVTGEKSICANKTDMDARMAYGYISIAFNDNLLDESKPGYPFDRVTKSIISRYSAATSTQHTYLFSPQRFYTVENFYYYFPKTTLYETISLSAQQESLIANPYPLFHLNFFLEDRTDVYFRTYNTFFDVFGNIGGIQSFLFFLLSLISSPITKQAYQIGLLNSLFAFEEEGAIASKQIGSKNQLAEVTQSAFTRRLSMSPMRASTARSDNNSLKKFLTKKDKKLRLRFWEYLTLQFCGRRKNLIQQGLEKVEKQLDIGVIINKLFELEKLKHLLLNENQVKLFEYIPKPTICFRPDITATSSVMPLQKAQSLNFFSEDKDFDSKVLMALEAYKNLKLSRDVQDLKLIEMMDHEVRDLFEEITPETEFARYGNEFKSGRSEKNFGISDYLEELTPVAKN